MIVIRYQSFPANAVLTHRFESVQRSPLRCDGTRAGIKRGPPLRIFRALFNLVRGAFRGFDEGFSWPFWLTSAAFAGRWQRVVRYSRCTNFCRPLVGWSFGALAQACKQSSCRFADSLHSFVAPAFHEQQQTTKEFGNVRQSVGVENECR